MGRVASFLRGQNRRWMRLARARAGNAAVVVALALPALATMALGATDVAAIMGDRGRMRSIAEAAALAGARNLSVAMSEADAKEHARAMATAMIGEWRGGPNLAVTVSIEREALGAKAVRVRLDAQRPSFFGDLLPPGGWKYDQQATASSVGAKPLCVLAFSDGATSRLYMRDRAEIRAPDCLVHSNSDVEVVGGRIEAGQTQAVRAATGDITPEPITDAPPIRDPFADLTMDHGVPCVTRGPNLVGGIIQSGNHTLKPGVHCGAIAVLGNATLTLAPGEHRFQLGAFVMGQNARLVGEDVVLIFDASSIFKFTGNASINLSGRSSGAYAGFVAMASRSNKLRFEIDSTRVERLDGVIYTPSAELLVFGNSDVARESDWTVIVADRLSLRGNPRLYLNADYDDSDLLVPGGVGNRRDAVRLID